DKQNSSSWCTDPAFATYKPTRLRIRVTGLGPRDSKKNMELVVDRYTLTYDVNATITLPNGSGNPIPFALGDSNPSSYSGVDISGSGSLPAFAISNADYTAINNVMDGC